ncbi:Lrp/AsnC family transcriptional regulator [Neomegalonema perideroedes]|uniref:Lrp/AsnC family transcriptional regulator n=1 Tax=Neomegalonema perideroedes TaxID=217219 RepID=UPI00037C7464|nr:Lrp/AsnC family transcriptional regulator [Neomegalonema perideroedes]
MIALDARDREILRLLRLDARMSNADLAAQVGLSASACLRRVRRLEESGVIRGYAALVNLSGPEAPMTVMVEITLERQTEDHLSRFEAAARRHPEIRECYLMTGSADYFLKVEAPNAADFERIHTEILAAMPGVSRIHSSFAIRNALATRTRTRRN